MACWYNRILNSKKNKLQLKTLGVASKMTQQLRPLFQKTWDQFLEPKWQLTTLCNSNSTNFDKLSGFHGDQAHMWYTFDTNAVKTPIYMK